MNRFEQYKERIKGNNIVFNIVKMMGGAAIGQIVILISAPIIARLYLPEQFGEMGFVTSIVGFVWFLGTQRLELAIPIEKSEEEQLNIAFYSMFFATIFSVMVFIFCQLFLENILSKFDLNFTSYYSLAIAVGIWIVSLFQVGQHLLIGSKQYGTTSIASSVQQGGISVLQVVFGIVRPIASTLVFAYILGFVFAIIYQLYFIKEIRFNRILNRIKRIDLKVFYNKYKKYPLYMAPSSFANTASLHLPVTFLTLFYTPEIAGFFMLCQRIIGLPVNLVVKAISQVFFGEFPSMIKNKNTKTIYLLKKSTKYLAILGIFPMVFLAYYSDRLVPFIFGKEWLLAGRIMSIIALMYYARLVTAQASLLLVVLDKKNIQFVWDFCRFLYVIIIFLMGYYFSLDYILIIKLFSFGMAFFYIIHYLISTYFLKKQLSR